MRTHFCGLVDETLIGQTVTLAGWTDVARNQGGVCFIDLRDHEGIVQVTVEVDNAEVFAVAASLGYEDVLQVEGVVRARHAVNDKMRTGKVEVIATAITDMDEDGDGWVNIGGVANRLRNTYSDFDQRTYGHAKLSELVRATGRFDVEVGPGGVMRVRLKPR